MINQHLKQELAQVVQSSHLSFLLGAGASHPFLPVLGNIEQKLNNTTDDNKKESIYKEYFEKIVLPTKKVINHECSEPIKDGSLTSTIASYKNFFATLGNILLKRKSTLLSKQVNIFTTNIDLLQEYALEEMRTEYNDGFSGSHTRIFRVENFRRIIKQKSLHFDYVSEIPVFNIIKMHGSVNWRVKEEDNRQQILLSHNLNHIDENLKEKSGEDFLESYRQILIVNPENSKHLQTVLNFSYSELLRLYSSTLEKENSALFVVGFSMSDEHIKEITLRSSRSNPTLQVYVFCYKEKEIEQMKKKLRTEEYPNIKVIPPSVEEQDLSKLMQAYFEDIWNSSIEDSEEGIQDSTVPWSKLE